MPTEKAREFANCMQDLRISGIRGGGCPRSAFAQPDHAGLVRAVPVDGEARVHETVSAGSFPTAYRAAWPISLIVAVMVSVFAMVVVCAINRL